MSRPVAADPVRLALPEVCLVVLIGPTGSGKSTFARRHFRPTQVLSSDAYRGIVADDETDQSASADAFDALHHVAGIRLRNNRLTVIDATNVQAHARAGLIRLAREHDVLPVAIVLDIPEAVCWERTQPRPDRDFGRPVVARQCRELRRSLGGLAREGFRAVHVLRGQSNVDDVEIGYEKLYNDRRDLTGPFDVIGDVHGCRAELEELLTRLGWHLVRDDRGDPVDAHHPDRRTAVFVGDLVDRGPDTPGVLRLVMGMVASGAALCVAGNHEEKLLRKLRGRNVRISHGLEQTLSQLAVASADLVEQLPAFLDGLLAHYVLDGGRLVVAHAGLKEAYHGRASARVRSFCLYGDTTGETDEYGLPVRLPWARDYRGLATVVYGHTPTLSPEWVNNTVCVDTGCVFGGALTALRYPERELVAVPAARVHYAPARPLSGSAQPVAAGSTALPDSPGAATAPEAPGTTTAAHVGAPAVDLLSVADVTGRRVIDTGYGRVTVPAEQAAAALEVMGRFAVDPRLLLWLPPTMPPCSTSTVEGYLEHPAQALADYRAAGVARVVLQEKHMGSRAVLLARRDGTGVCYTRTGRPFFTDRATGARLVARVAAAAGPLFDQLDSDWVLLDTELLPWSAKAEGLIREQYASVAAAAGAALPAALQTLAAAARRGLDVAALHARTAARAADATAFTAAYRRYCWPTAELDGVRLAPFAVLASAGTHHSGRDQGWQLDRVDQLAAADRELFQPTRRLVVDLASAEDEEAAIAWWLELTGGGGEGMVVKPFPGLARTPSGALAQPGLKCRGREYLRIVYGPEYTEPDRLERLRGRSLRRKRALAQREYALGLAALDRHAAAEPLWRVHEAVFAILACESEPVDPRL